MSWIKRLYDTYVIFQDKIGVMEPQKVPLLPVFHATQQAHIEAVVDIDGNWVKGRSRIVEIKEDMTTIIPCTEKSASRTSSPEPHPLFDKLQYTAGDYDVYGEKKKHAHQEYITSLEAWCASPYSHPAATAILNYVKKGCLIHDLLEDGLLCEEMPGKLLEKWAGPKDETPKILKVCPKQLDAFVRFKVYGAEESEAIWNDPSLWESWIQYQKHINDNLDICYVTGQQMAPSELSPKKIRNPGDGGKLISSNDASGFTFRGRFADSKETFSIGRETTEKAHNALRWLISKQGYVNGDQVVVAWMAKKEQVLPEAAIGADSFAFWHGAEKEDITIDGAIYAKEIRRALAGYKNDLSDMDQVTIMGLDSATPGRVSIFYYREMNALDFLNRLEKWHTSCTWLHNYRLVADGKNDKGKDKVKRVRFEGAPSPIDIVKAAYGQNVDDKLKKSAVERLLPCIIDGAPLPRDIMISTANRATKSIGMEWWEADKTLTIACALIRKYYNDKLRKSTTSEKELWNMEDMTSKDRSYLFGRALAYARKIEEWALWASKTEARQTNAERLQVAFSQHPAYTWKRLYERLLPYWKRFRTPGAGYEIVHRYEAELNEIMDDLEKSGGFTNEALSPVYLLGYATQQHKFNLEAEERKKKAEQGKDEVTKP